MKNSGSWRLLWLGMLTVAAALAAGLLPPFAQPAEYHQFADGRAGFGIANFLNVASNTAFLPVAASGLRLLQSDNGVVGAGTLRWTYACFFISVALTGLGSAYYHLAPDNLRLAWDRAAMALCFAALFAAMVGERISAKAGLALLLPLGGVAVASVVYWRASEIAGAGNLIPYLAMQVYFILALLSVVLLFPARYTHGGGMSAVAMLYAAALAADFLDKPIYALGQIVSGHTLKHLLAALAVYGVVRILRQRQPIATGAPR